MSYGKIHDESHQNATTRIVTDPYPLATYSGGDEHALHSGEPVPLRSRVRLPGVPDNFLSPFRTPCAGPPGTSSGRVVARLGPGRPTSAALAGADDAVDVLDVFRRQLDVLGRIELV